ncbi:hypothetical protein FGL68_07085 [Acinetobacter baumannii]|nr:hypothetical protein [Acinetobacter baumannii]
MNVLLRNISKDVVYKIDELATERGISRNEYLTNQLELLAYSDSLFELDNKYSILVEKILKVLDYNTLTLKKFLEENLLDLDEIVEENFLKGKEN